MTNSPIVTMPTPGQSLTPINYHHALPEVPLQGLCTPPPHKVVYFSLAEKM